MSSNEIKQGTNRKGRSPKDLTSHERVYYHKMSFKNQNYDFLITEGKNFVPVRGHKTRIVSDGDTWWIFNSMQKKLNVNERIFSGLKGDSWRTNILGKQLTSIVEEILKLNGIECSRNSQGEIEMDHIIIKVLTQYGIRQPQDLLLLRDLLTVDGEVNLHNLNYVLEKIYRMTFNGYLLNNLMKAKLEILNLKSKIPPKSIFEKEGNCQSFQLLKNIRKCFELAAQRLGALKSVDYILDKMEDAARVEARNTGVTVNYESGVIGSGRVEVDAIINVAEGSYLVESKYTKVRRQFANRFLSDTSKYGAQLYRGVEFSVRQGMKPVGVFMTTNYERFEELLRDEIIRNPLQIQQSLARGWHLINAKLEEERIAGNYQYLAFQGNLDLRSRLPGVILNDFKMVVICGMDMTIPALSPYVADTLATFFPAYSEEFTPENIAASTVSIWPR